MFAMFDKNNHGVITGAQFKTGAPRRAAPARCRRANASGSLSTDSVQARGRREGRGAALGRGRPRDVCAGSVRRRAARLLPAPRITVSPRVPPAAMPPSASGRWRSSLCEDVSCAGTCVGRSNEAALPHLVARLHVQQRVLRLRVQQRAVRAHAGIELPLGRRHASRHAERCAHPMSHRCRRNAADQLAERATCGAGRLVIDEPAAAQGRALDPADRRLTLTSSGAPRLTLAVDGRPTSTGDELPRMASSHTHSAGGDGVCAASGWWGGVGEHVVG